MRQYNILCNKFQCIGPNKLLGQKIYWANKLLEFIVQYIVLDFSELLYIVIGFSKTLISSIKQGTCAHVMRYACFFGLRYAYQSMQKMRYGKVGIILVTM